MTGSAMPRPSEPPAYPPPGRAGEDVRWLDPSEKRAWMALLEASTGLFELLEHDLKGETNLALEDYEILHLLSVEPERRLRVGELSERMLASRTRLSQRIDRLVKRGVLDRQRCPEDRRAINVVLTDDGFDLLAQVAPHHLRSVRHRLFDHLTTTDVAALGRILDKVVQSVREQRASPPPCLSEGQDLTETEAQA